MRPCSCDPPWSEYLPADKFWCRGKEPGPRGLWRVRCRGTGETCEEDLTRPRATPGIRSTEGCNFFATAARRPPRHIALPTEGKRCKRNSGRECHAAVVGRCGHGRVAQSIVAAIAATAHTSGFDSGRSRRKPRHRHLRTKLR